MNMAFGSPDLRYSTPFLQGKLTEHGGKKQHGALAQLVARYIRIVEVSGSNPLCSTTKKPLKSQDFEGFCLLSIFLNFAGKCHVIYGKWKNIIYFSLRIFVQII